MRENQKKKQRVAWVDIAKALVILAVVIAHTVSGTFWGSQVRALGLSFSMSMYFALSCYTYTFSDSMDSFWEKTKKAFRHLIIPALITYVLWICLDIFSDFGRGSDLEFWKGKIYSLLFASGVDTTFLGFEVPAIRMTWFFFSLFLGRSIYDYLHLQFEEGQRIVLTMLCSVAGVLFGVFHHWMPFSLDIALAVMPFFYMGEKMKTWNLQKNPVSKLVLWGVVWLVLFYLTFPDYRIATYMEYAFRRYTLYPLCFVSAMAGSLWACEASILLDRIKGVRVPLRFLGRNTLYFLCVHIMDDAWSKIWFYPEKQFFSAGLRVISDLVIFVVVMCVVTLVKKRKR